jgi:hypothetical protein
MEMVRKRTTKSDMVISTAEGGKLVGSMVGYNLIVCEGAGVLPGTSVEVPEGGFDRLLGAVVGSNDTVCARVGIIVGRRIDGVEGSLGTADSSDAIGCDKVGVGVGSLDPTGVLVRTAARSRYSVGKLIGIVEGVTERHSMDGMLEKKLGSRKG